MKKGSSGSRKGDEARVKVVFRVPIDFAFKWCTDYTPEDAALEEESYTRKIIERSSRRVIFEDLEDTPSGWVWGRDVVTLRPPNRWSMKGVGNRRDVTAEYLLTSLPNGRTQLELRWWRSPKPPGRKIRLSQRFPHSRDLDHHLPAAAAVHAPAGGLRAALSSLRVCR